MARAIVVVDDEKLVLFGICSLLAENNSGFEVAAACSSGEEGLKVCLEKAPDLLLTDIGMPGMDGLTLIRTVRQANPDIRIVVLSCHDEYELVHQAFMLGADDYILKKDIDKESLSSVLKRIFPDESSFDVHQRGSERIPSLSEIADITPGKPCSLGLIGFKGDDCGDSAETKWQPDIPMLYQLIKDDIKPSGSFYLGPHNDPVIIFSGICADENSRLNRLLEKTRRSISKYVNRQVFIAGHGMSETESFGEAYKEGHRILDGFFYCSGSTVLTRKTVVPPWKTPLIFSASQYPIYEYWEKAAEDFFDTAMRQWASPEAVKAELVFAVKHLFHQIEKNTGSLMQEDGSYDATACCRTINQLNDFNLLRRRTKELLGDIADDIKNRISAGGAVNRTKLYVSENLHRDLRLNVVADIIGINANHLSTIFKRETTEGYIEYVNRKRVELACELIETTDMPAKEIAWRCGYPNPNYFSRIFKKLTNSTVSGYRACRRL